MSSRGKTGNIQYGYSQTEQRVGRPQRGASFSQFISRSRSVNTFSKPESPVPGRDSPIGPETIALQQQVGELKRSLEAERANSEHAAKALERERQLCSERDKQSRELSATLQEERHKVANMQSTAAAREREFTKELEGTKQRLASAEALARARQAELQDTKRSSEDQRQKSAQQQSASAAREEALTNELLSTRRQLATAASDLALVRAVSGDEGDAQALVTMFDDITDEIGDFAFRLDRKIRTGCRSTAVSTGHLDVLRQSGENVYGFLRQYLEHCARQSVPAPDTLNSITEAVVNWLLVFTIFDAFMPLGNIEDQRFSSDLLKLQEDIRSVEPQEYSARWRSVTYKAMTRGRDDAALARNIVTWVASYLMFTFSAFVDQSVANRGIQELEADLTDIVTKALRWQDQARTRHYTYDYAGFLPLENSSFVEAEMDMESEVDGAVHAAKRVVMLPLSMGLKASRSEASANGPIRAHKVLKKAQVLVG